MSKSEKTKYGSRSGHAILTAVIFFTAISLAIAIGASTPAMKAITTARLVGDSNQSFFAAEAIGRDMFSRLDRGLLVDTTETLTIGGATAEATLTGMGATQTITASGSTRSAVRAVAIQLTSGTGAAFHYGVQAGAGGIVMENTSSINGNLYSNGTVVGSGSNIIRGTVASADVTGLIQGVHATSSAYAHTINNSTIDGNAYYTTINNTTVLGTLFPGSPDQATSSMPISDAQIAEWEAQALAGGTTSSCTFSGGAITLGPKKMTCDLSITGNTVITLDGPLWVVGNITIANSVDMIVNPTYGNASIAIIADKPADPLGSGRITLQNTAEFFGAGSNSYVLMVSMNKSASQGGSTKAITLQNSANGDLLLYAPYGEINLQNSASLKEVTAYKLRLSNSSQVSYSSGLANLIFTSGPGGGYAIDSWQEVE